jgi:hypothetical protein
MPRTGQFGYKIGDVPGLTSEREGAITFFDCGGKPAA